MSRAGRWLGEARSNSGEGYVQYMGIYVERSRDGESGPPYYTVTAELIKMVQYIGLLNLEHL